MNFLTIKMKLVTLYIHVLVKTVLESLVTNDIVPQKRGHQTATKIVYNLNPIYIKQHTTFDINSSKDLRFM